MKNIIRHTFADGKQSVSDNPNTVIIINKQAPVEVIGDSVSEEQFDKKGFEAVKQRDKERLEEKIKEAKERLAKGKKK